MPLPKPKKKEKEDDFISRCMGDETVKKDFPDNKQRVAVCFSQWEKKSKASVLIEDHVILVTLPDFENE